MTYWWVDDRYTGTHGIARYAREVVTRLSTSWRPLAVTGKPAAATDAFARLPAFGPDERIYSPGYAGFAVRVPQLLTVHDLIHLRTRWPGRARYLAYYESIVRPAVRRSGTVFTVSETSADAIREWIRDDDVCVVNTGNACSDVFRSDGPASDGEGPYVLFVGNMRAHKNARIALDAIRLLPGLRLRMLIPAGEADAAAAAAARVGVGDRVDLLHGVSDEALASHYRGAQATLLPSTVEGFGLPALESVCCGTPVIHWAGCRAVGEAALGRGTAIDRLDDVAEWAEALRSAGGSGRSQDVDRPTWQSVASIVDSRLSQVHA